MAVTALAAVVACLEHEARSGQRPESRVLALTYLPLLVPQIGFLFGLQVLFVRLGLDATLTGLAWSHLVFVLPYTLLMLRGPYLAFDPRWLATGRTLGSGPNRLFWRVRLPLLRRPILVALAVGFSVSVAQYLPTLFIGAGRHPDTDHRGPGPGRRRRPAGRGGGGPAAGGPAAPGPGGSSRGAVSPPWPPRAPVRQQAAPRAADA